MDKNTQKIQSNTAKIKQLLRNKNQFKEKLIELKEMKLLLSKFN